MVRTSDEAVDDGRAWFEGFLRADASRLRQVVVARYGAEAGQWRIAGGTHRVALGHAADDLVLAAEAELSERRFGR